MAGGEDWKKKYQAESAAHERATRNWQDERLLLQRLVARTSVAAKGQRASLDLTLDQLRNTIRTGHADLERLEEIRCQLDQELRTMGDRGADDTLQRARIVDTVLALLDHLLDRVELPDNSRVELMSQRDRLANHLDWETLQQTLDDIHRLVSATIKRLQDEFAGFLRLLEERLADVRSVFERQAEGSTQRRHTTIALEQSVQENLAALGAKARESSSIETLRSAVIGQVDSIADDMSKFREAEMTREAALAEELAAAQDKIDAMEVQSHSVRQMLEEERVRASTDPLTQLPNRAVWEERLSFEEARWQRYGHPVVIGVIDIDRFKDVNDTHGHKIGDRVLQLVASTIRANLRRTDFIARYGGEEFVMLLTDTHPDIAMQVANGLREHVADAVMAFEDVSVKVTVSVGLAALSQASDASSAFDMADRALYDAKRRGRNQVSMAGD